MSSCVGGASSVIIRAFGREGRDTGVVEVDTGGSDDFVAGCFGNDVDVDCAC